LALVLAACIGDGSVTIAAPRLAISSTTVLQLVPDTGDRAVASALGWSSGIPGAAVTVHLPDGDRTAVSDASGNVTLTAVEAGSYVIEAIRVLSDGEVAKVPASEGALGFAVKTSVNLSGAGGSLPVTVPAARKRGLIISESAFEPGLLPGITSYLFGGYLELYNNGDTTVFLDSMLVGAASATAFAGQSQWCQEYNRLKLDPNNIWSMEINRFPGRGHDFPVHPGQVIVIATDAIDHRPIIAGGLDLSHADFEFLGYADVDNPAVPNVVEIARPEYFGHGFFEGSADFALFLARPFDIAMAARTALQLTGLDPQETDFAIPRDHVLDVYSHHTFHSEAGYGVSCLPVISPAWDRESASITGTWLPDEFLVSHTRRLFVERAGRKYLLSTHSSRTDFMPGTRTVGTVP
jgi:hypothetical protein